MSIDFKKLTKSKLLVVGDVMLDRYWSGHTERISPEAPVPVVHIQDSMAKPGGAANVALNLATLGAQVSLLGVCGDDEAGQQLNDLLRKTDVQSELLVKSGAQTITKLRIHSRHQQLIRLDREQPGLNSDKLLPRFQKLLKNCTGVIISDYRKGTLRGVIPAMMMAARAAKVPVYVDPKGSEAEPYRGASLLTPNQREFEQLVGGFTGEVELEEKARKLLSKYEIAALLITRSERGMTLIPAEGERMDVPAYQREVFDVTGAGDTVIAVLTAAIAAEYSLPQAVRLANLAASVVVGKLGATSVTLDELHAADYQQRQTELKRGVFDREALQDLVSLARQGGERIVMSNGCFDLLHAGHVDNLQRAAELGDRLIVAVNDDDSVRNLKGPSRPLVPVEQRMAVLSALACVDWVVSFSEETPEELIGQILPDVLAKGGDYRAEDIAGYAAVTKNGGEVVVLPLLEGLSTSDIVAKIRQQKP